MTIYKELRKRILILDGGMGTEIMNADLEYDGNNDALPLTDPDFIIGIHKAYINAGADIISTCSFGANAVTQKAYGLQVEVRKLNLAAAIAARCAADNCSDHKVWVMGSMGPTSKSVTAAEMKKDQSETITFEALKQDYITQAIALTDGGVDGFLVETVTDLRNAEAALQAIREVLSKRGFDLPIMVSATLAGDGGCLVSGSTIQEFVNMAQRYDPLSIGLNCCSGATGIVPYVREISSMTKHAVSVYPSAGPPTAFGYNERPSYIAGIMAEMANERLINIAGGCCGTTPEYISEIADALDGFAPRKYYNKYSPINKIRSFLTRFFPEKPEVTDNNGKL